MRVSQGHLKRPISRGLFIGLYDYCCGSISTARTVLGLHADSINVHTATGRANHPQKKTKRE
jgi:hypothetical protein